MSGRLIYFIFALGFSAQQLHAQGDHPMDSLSPAPQITLFDANPDHLWNRLYSTLFIRIDSSGKSFGIDSLDVLLWTETKHLVGEPSHMKALKVLDEFIDTHGEQLVQDPVKRVVLQHDLWAAYRWAERAEIVNEDVGMDPATFKVKIQALKSRFGLIIKRLALSQQQIEALPDNYAAAIASKEFSAIPKPAHSEIPFLPPDLFQRDSPWVCLGLAHATLASQHDQGVGDRSAFLVFLRLPEGHAATGNYVDRISAVWFPKWNPYIPQITVGTMVALVRQMVVIDDQGDLVPTHLTESVQLRVYRNIGNTVGTNGTPDQDFYESTLKRGKLFAGISGGLSQTTRDEGSFTFGPNIDASFSGKDPFEFSEPVRTDQTMQTCVGCHISPGVYSVNSINDLFQRRSLAPLRSLHESTPNQERENVIDEAYSENSQEFLFPIIRQK